MEKEKEDKKIKSKKGKVKSSPVWLVILLCGIIVFLVWLVSSVKYQNIVSSLSEEIQRLGGEIERVKEEKRLKEEEIKRIREDLFKSASSGAELKATVSGELKETESEVATKSGE